jgi:hypothetical protein
VCPSCNGRHMAQTAAPAATGRAGTDVLRIWTRDAHQTPAATDSTTTRSGGGMVAGHREELKPGRLDLRKQLGWVSGEPLPAVFSAR